MEFLKDIYEAWGARIKSSLFGSIILAFMVVNWKPIFFVIFAKVTVIEKFVYFDANTNPLSLYAFPVAIGAVLALGLPYLNLLVHRAISAPINRMRKHDDVLASERLAAKSALSLLRTQAHEQREKALIAQAERDEEVEEKIKDPERREELQKKLEESRADEHIGSGKEDAKDTSDLSQPEFIKLSASKEIEKLRSQLSDFDLEHLDIVCANVGGKFQLEEYKGSYALQFDDGDKIEFDDREHFLQVRVSFLNLLGAGLLSMDRKESYSVTADGYKYWRELESQA